MWKIVLLIFAAVLLWAAVAEATPPHCDKRKNIADKLNKKYEEQSVAVGLAVNGSLLEVFASPNGETWSIIVSNTKGRACVLATGEGWRYRKVVAGEKL